MNDYQPDYPAVAFPTEKWLRLAETKMTRGYVLIFHPTKASANFFKAGKGYEPCPPRIARYLLEKGLLTELGNHYLGTMYQLSPEAKLTLLPKQTPTRAIASDEEEFDVTLLADGDSEEATTADEAEA